MFKTLLKTLADRAGYMILKKQYPLDIQQDKEFMSVLREIEPYTMVDTDRSLALYTAVKYVTRAGIPGDFVECGVWKGGQAMLMARTLLAQGANPRTIWLYDTFTGMSEPTSVDVFAYPEDPAPIKWENLKKEDHVDWCYASEEEVRKNVLSTGYPKEKFEFVKGKVEDTVPNKIPDTIAVLRLDTDWYESTKHELEHLFPRLAVGGVLIIDDYGSWEGARKAVDEYFEQHRIKMLLTRAGPGRVGVKV